MYYQYILEVYELKAFKNIHGICHSMNAAEHWSQNAFTKTIFENIQLPQNSSGAPIRCIFTYTYI